MNEPIVVARLRKPVELKLKAGDWMVVVSPDSNFSEANKKFDTMLDPVNDTYNRVIIGKIQHSRNAQNPQSKEEMEKRLQLQSKTTQHVQEVVATAQQNQANQQKVQQEAIVAQQAKDLKDHQSTIEKIRKATNYRG